MHKTGKVLTEPNEKRKNCETQIKKPLISLNKQGNLEENIMGLTRFFQEREIQKIKAWKTLRTYLLESFFKSQQLSDKSLLNRSMNGRSSRLFELQIN